MPSEPLATSPPRYLVGCIVALCALMAVLMAVGVVVGVMTQLLDPDPTVPHPVILAVMAGGSCAALCAFFVTVTRRLYARWRGAEVARLMPVWLSVGLATVLGVGGVVSSVLALRYHTVTGLGAGVCFIVYAVATTWRRARAARRDPSA